MRPGIEVLLTDSLSLIRNRRIGLVTNQSGIDSKGRRDLDRLVAAGLRVTAVLRRARPAGTLTSTLRRCPEERTPPLGYRSTLHVASAPPPTSLMLDPVMSSVSPDAGARYYTYRLPLRRSWTAAVGPSGGLLDRPIL